MFSELQISWMELGCAWALEAQMEAGAWRLFLVPASAYFFDSLERCSEYI